MHFEPEQIEQLLHEEEGTSLDFKREQYKFEGASNEEKSEILKDILAFSNAFRRADAYIILGVEEIRGKKSKVIGVHSHLDDAKLQQFINSKTQRPVTFSYRESTHEGLEVGIIHIPIQLRPIYSKINYGKVKKGKVYLRRSSSTDVATPEEIIQMGTTDVNLSVQPSIELNIVNRRRGEILGNSISVEKCTWYEVPHMKNIPNYTRGSSLNVGGGSVQLPDPTANPDFLREVAAYVQTNSCIPICLEMRNTGISVIQDANVVFLINDQERRYEIIEPNKIADTPDRSNLVRLSKLTQITIKHDVTVNREGEDWKIECKFGKIQPGATVRLQDDILIGARSAGKTSFFGTVYADNIRSPISVQLNLEFQIGSQKVAIDEILDMANSPAQKG